MAQWPYTWPWARVRKVVLARDGYTCQVRGPRCTVRATDVDHIVPPRLAPHLRLALTNLRASCNPCNLDRRGQAEPSASRRWFS